MKWLGLDWDGEALSQFSRIARHGEVAAEMLARGTAYKCFATRDEIDAFRAEAKADGRPPLFLSPWRDADPSTHPQGADYTVRLKAPREGRVVVEDKVQGTVSWDAATLDDLILLRSDATPTYMLAVVADDHDMGVTHVIRGDDHLTNAARQTLIYRAMDWAAPVFAHIPLIHGPDGAKLSKRHGALGIEAYRDLGYLPAALRNYLARLGWSHGDDEFFTAEQAIEWFGLEQVGKSAARFDLAKLENLNGQHIRATPDGDLVAAVEGLIAAQHEPPISAARKAMLTQAMPGLKERAKTLVELIDMSQYILSDRPFEAEQKAAKHLAGDAPATLCRLTVRLQNARQWTAGSLEEIVRAFAEEEQLKLGRIAQPLRVALTGRAVSPGVFDVMETLGRDETLARLGDVVTTP